MTADSYQKLMVDLDGRFRELGIFCNELSNFHLKAMLRGELLMVVTNGDYCTMSWVPATEKSLERLFSGSGAV